MIFFFNDTATTEIYTLSLHDALPISGNTVVIHPSSTTSISLLEFGKLLNKVLPAGVVNIITGRGSRSGNYMLQHIVTRLRSDRKSTRLNSSHANISYAVFCLKKKKRK